MGDISPAGMGGGDADGVSAATDGGFEKFRKMREEAAARAAAEAQPVASKSADVASGKKGAHASNSNGKKSGARGGGDDDWGDENNGAGTRGGKGGGGSKPRGGGDDWNDDGWVRRAREGTWTRRDERALCTVVLLAPRVAADCLSVYREMTMMAGVPGPPPRWLSTHTHTQTHRHTHTQSA